jgi:hypothetical protein
MMIAVYPSYTYKAISHRKQIGKEKYQVIQLEKYQDKENDFFRHFKKSKKLNNLYKWQIV